MKQIIVVTGASSGFGRMAAEELAKAGHTVYAGIRETTGRNAPQVAALDAFAAENGVDLHAVEMDVEPCSSNELSGIWKPAKHSRSCSCL